MDNDRESQALAIIKAKLSKDEANLVVQNRNMIDLVAGIPLKNLQMIEAKQLRELFQLKGEQFAAYAEMINQQVKAAKHDIKIQRIKDYQEIAELDIDLELEEARQRAKDVKRRSKTRDLIRENEELEKELELQMSILVKKQELEMTKAAIKAKEETMADSLRADIELDDLEREVEIVKLKAKIENIKNPPERPKRMSKDERIQDVTKKKLDALQGLKDSGVAEDSMDYKRIAQYYDQILMNLTT